MEDEEKREAVARLRQAYIVDRFAGPILQPEIIHEQIGYHAYQHGRHPSDCPFVEGSYQFRHWHEGYSVASNYRYRTLPGNSPRIPRPPRGHIV